MIAALKSHDRAKAFSVQMPNADYHKCEELSNSQNNTIIDESPGHFKYYKENPRPRTESMITGEIVHLLTLEPDKFFESAVAMPECDRRTKAGKEFYEKFMIENEGKVILKNDVYHQAFGMVGSVVAHPTASLLLKNNHNELSFFGEIDGVKVRCRPDIIRGGQILADLKTTESAKEADFQRTLMKYKYHRQAAFYCDLVAQVTGETYDSFSFIAVEKCPPYAVQVFTLEPVAIQRGREEYKRGLEIYRKCLETNTWPMYSEKAVSLELPQWAY